MASNDRRRQVARPVRRRLRGCRAGPLVGLLLAAATPLPARSAPGLPGFLQRGGTGSKQSRFLPVNQAFRFELVRTGAGAYRAHWDIAPGYYLYRKRLRFQLGGTNLIRAGDVRLPAARIETDPYLGRVRIYRGSLDVRLRLVHPASDAVLVVRYQGCAQAGICYPPQTRRVPLRDAARAATIGLRSGASSPPADASRARDDPATRRRRTSTTARRMRG